MNVTVILSKNAMLRIYDSLYSLTSARLPNVWVVDVLIFWQGCISYIEEKFETGYVIIGAVSAAVALTMVNVWTCVTNSLLFTTYCHINNFSHII